MRPLSEDLIKIAGLLLIDALLLLVLWSFTGAPMMANYRDHGSIFIARNTAPPKKD